MSVRNSLLAILDVQPAHGYGLKSTFEHCTAGLWPLNVGQVYTTLARLERDGMVRPEGVGRDDRQQWRITPAGRKALAEWYHSPVDERALRDELAIKVLLAVAVEGVDVQQVIQTQRVATLRQLQEYTRYKREADPESQLAWVLLLDALILKAEAEIKWLDLCDQRLGRRRRRPS